MIVMITMVLMIMMIGHANSYSINNNYFDNYKSNINDNRVTNDNGTDCNNYKNNGNDTSNNDDNDNSNHEGNNSKSDNSNDVIITITIIKIISKLSAESAFDHSHFNCNQILFLRNKTSLLCKNTRQLFLSLKKSEERCESVILGCCCSCCCYS